MTNSTRMKRQIIKAFSNKKVEVLAMEAITGNVPFASYGDTGQNKLPSKLVITYNDIKK